MPQHTDKQFEAELKCLKEQILKAAGTVEEMMNGALKALVDRNSNIAEKIIQRDSEIDQLEMDIDDRCLQLLALRQPAASDLRFITIGLKISKDLERMGDLAVNISEQVLALNKEPQLKTNIDLSNMADEVQKMIKDALDAFVSRDVIKAQEVCKVDDKVDRMNDQVFEKLIEVMQKNPQAAARGTRLNLIARHLERLADHATNIAEEVIFMAQGKDIRHGNK